VLVPLLLVVDPLLVLVLVLELLPVLELLLPVLVLELLLPLLVLAPPPSSPMFTVFPLPPPPHAAAMTSAVSEDACAIKTRRVPRRRLMVLFSRFRRMLESELRGA
jgi:hypothetical protein